MIGYFFNQRKNKSKVDETIFKLKIIFTFEATFFE